MRSSVSEANAWCYWFYVVSQLGTVPLPSEQPVKALTHCFLCLCCIMLCLSGLPLHHPLYFLAALTRLCMPSLLRSLLSRVFPAWTEITVFALSEFMCPLILIHFHPLFFCLKIYCTATQKVIWPLKAFMSQAAFSALLAFPKRRGFSQKGARCSHDDSCVQQVLVGEGSTSLRRETFIWDTNGNASQQPCSASYEIGEKGNIWPHV